MRRRGGVPTAAPASGRRTAKTASKPYGFRLDAFGSSSSIKVAPIPASPLRHHPAPAASPQRAVATISDLKELASSRIDAVKRNLDHGHSEILKELEASSTRLSKRFKVQTQACLQLSEEVENDYKRMSERITENMELMEASFSGFMADVQASVSRACKVTITELAQSMEKAIENLRGRYKIPPPSA